MPITDLIQESYVETIESLSWSLEKAKRFAIDYDTVTADAIERVGNKVPFCSEQNPIKAIDSFINKMPSGNETGNYYAIDLGGTNCRAVCVQLLGGGKCTTIHKERNIREYGMSEEAPKGMLDRNTPASVMFDAIAEITKQLMLEIGDDPAAKRQISFTFSFPVNQHSLSNGTLVCWTKEFETGINTNDPVEGQDVSELLNAAYRRAKMGTAVGAIINDTVGTLLSAGYEHNATANMTYVGVILGTGYNMASHDPYAKKCNYVGTVVNHESGNYSGVEPFQSSMDTELNFNSADRDGQLTEKMVAGHYLGEICRLAYLKVFKHMCSQEVWRPWKFETPDAAAIYADNTKHFKITKSVCKEKLDWVVESEDELRMIYKLTCAVFERSATIAALMCSVLASRTRSLQKALGGVTIGVDGSLYLRNAKYRKTFRKTLDKILGPRGELVHIVAADDGSGKGAAVLASTLSSAY